MARIQFILKQRDNPYYTDHADQPANGFLSSGLLNSARFVEDMLKNRLGCETKLDHAIDNNCIDRLVTAFRPDICIIEAYWVVPEKFEVLTKLHPNVLWVVRNHSATPFAATEGIVFDWSLRYMDHPNVVLACNDERTDREFSHLIGAYKPEWPEEEVQRRCAWLPNYYPDSFTKRSRLPRRNGLDIACFGALRPLKNQVAQAVAALEFAECHGAKLRFHINGTRMEGRGEPVLHNLRALFRNLPHHDLIEHPWLSHEDFIDLVRQMHLSMQVSYTETFNIVTADAVMNDVPVVTSREVRWVDPLFYADPNDTESIVKAIGCALWRDHWMPWSHRNIAGLRAYDRCSLVAWRQFIERAIRHQAGC